MRCRVYSLYTICDLPPLQRTISLLCGISSLSTLMLHPPRGSSCKRMHDLFCLSIHAILPQRLLLPSACTLRLPGSILDVPIDFNAPPANSALNSLCVPDNMPLPPTIFPLCCPHTCGPPDFEPLDDRRMERPPIHPSAQGSSSAWVLQWVCRSCGSSPARVLNVPPLLGSCLTSPLTRYCVSSQSPNDDPADWFSHGPLSRFASLHGLGRGNPAPPGFWQPVLALPSIDFVGACCRGVANGRGPSPTCNCAAAIMGKLTLGF